MLEEQDDSCCAVSNETAELSLDAAADKDPRGEQQLLVEEDKDAARSECDGGRWVAEGEFLFGVERGIRRIPGERQREQAEVRSAGLLRRLRGGRRPGRFRQHVIYFMKLKSIILILHFTFQVFQFLYFF